MEYFIIDNNGQQAGPFSQDQLVQKAISPETLGWKQHLWWKFRQHNNTGYRKYNTGYKTIGNPENGQNI